MDTQAHLAAPAARHAIRPRNPELSFAEVPRRWFGGSVVATNLANGVNLLFPAGERFFVRSVRHFLSRIEDDPELLQQVKGFFAQEGRHAGTHERFFEVLEAQGYDLKRFLHFYERVAYAVIERVTTPELRLSATAALEHFTAIMAEDALARDLLRDADPTMKRFLLWHAAEEIEHKSVAFDVLKKVNPSYALRLAGMGIATLTLGGFWIAAALVLLRQDGIGLGAVRAELRTLRARDPIAKRVFARGIREYVKRDFHPSQNDNYHLATAFLTREKLA